MLNLLPTNLKQTEIFIIFLRKLDLYYYFTRRVCRFPENIMPYNTILSFLTIEGIRNKASNLDKFKHNIGRFSFLSVDARL